MCPVQPCAVQTRSATAAPRREPAGSLEDRAAHALLESLTQGNTRAFWELWGLYRGQLYHICLSHMDGVREDAEDALSRAMLRALDKLPHIGSRIENVRAWLIRLTINLCADMHRERKRRARRVEHIDDVLPNVGDSLPAAIDSPEDVFLSREAYVCMRHAVNDLPARLREPFALRFFQEMPYVDIAARLMLSNDNVRKRIQQARGILRRRLALPVAGDGVASPGLNWAAQGLLGSMALSQIEPGERLLGGSAVSTRRHTQEEAPDGW